MRRHRLRFLSAAALLLALSGPCLADDAAPALPPGWTLFRTGPLGRNDLDCAQRATTAWSVGAEADRITIAPLEGSPRSPVTWTRFAGGRLMGEDHGEWGGGVWWNDIQGRRGTKISNENAVGFLQTRFGMLAFVGVDHLSLRRGRILIIEWPTWGAPPATTVLTELGEAPHAFIADRSGNVLVATGTRVLRIAAPGRGSDLFASTDGLPQPNSLAVTSTGVIAVGMRLVVLQLVPSGEGYRGDWLRPATCRRFAPAGLTCSCSSE